MRLPQRRSRCWPFRLLAAWLLLPPAASALPPGVGWPLCWPGDEDRRPAPAAPGHEAPSFGYHGENFRADLVAFFHKLRGLSGLKDVDLVYEVIPPRREGAPRECEACSYRGPDGRGVVQIGPDMRRYVQNREELAFVIAHELGHLAKEHARLRAESLGRAVEEWDEKLTATGRTGEDPALLQHELEKAVCPEKGRLLRAQEYESDAYAAELLARAGFDPAHGREGFLRVHDALWEEGNAFYEYSHPAPLRRAETLDRIISDGLKPLEP